jgi:hypothetical protein
MSLSRRNLWISSIALASLAAPLTAHAYKVKTPWRGDSLPVGSYMMTKGHGDDYNCPNGDGEGCGMDFKVWRHVSGSAYTLLIPSPTGIIPRPHTDFLGFGKQLYAPFDGEVIACWRNMPEEEPGGGDPDECTDALGEDCALSGNHMIIRSMDQTHTIYLAHLQRNSIPAGLCPIVTVALDKDEPKLCTLANRKGIADATRIDKITPAVPFPKVRMGQEIAKIGNSGSSTEPHLHMSVATYAEDASGNPCLSGVPFEFSESWVQEKPATGDLVASDWDTLTGEELVFDGTEYFIWGDPMAPKIDELSLVDGTMPAVALTVFAGVSAFKNDDDKFEATGFIFDGAGEFVLGVGDEDVVVSDLDIARHGNTDNHVIAAMINAADQLRILPYFVASDGDLTPGTPQVEPTPGTQLVRATQAPTHNGIVVATKNSLDGISVINYKSAFSGNTMSVTRMDDAENAAEIVDLDVATVVAGRGLAEGSGAFKGVVTASRRADDTLWLQGWQINSTGTSITPGTPVQVTSHPSNASFDVADVDISVTGIGGREFIVVSAITSSGNLRVQSWQISSTGVLGRVSQYDGGGPLLQLSSARSGGQEVTVGARFTGNSHTLLSFSVSAAGVLGRSGTMDGGVVSGLAVAGRSSPGDLVTLFTHAATGEVNVTRYLTNYMNSL